MVEGFGVEMSDEQAKTIGNQTDGCPLALMIIGTELRSPEMGVPEMIHTLKIEILKLISDHSYQNLSRFQAVMNVAYNRLSASKQLCAQQVSFFLAPLIPKQLYKYLEEVSIIIMESDALQSLFTGPCSIDTGSDMTTTTWKRDLCYISLYGSFLC